MHQPVPQLPAPFTTDLGLLSLSILVYFQQFQDSLAFLLNLCLIVSYNVESSTEDGDFATIWLDSSPKTADGVLAEKNLAD